MPNTVLSPLLKYPVGTTVSAYLRSACDQRRRRAVPPAGIVAATEAVAVAADGTLTFTTLTTGTQYCCHAQVSGEERWLDCTGT